MSSATLPNLVILTGAGISAESGLPTFRDADGLWEGNRVEDVATPAAFDRNPALVHRFYNLRRKALLGVKPNAAHEAIAKLQLSHPGCVTLITQNVDDLHERAGSPEVIHMHGELRKAQCEWCESVHPWDEDMDYVTRCPTCRRPARMRPHIVWFGEMPMHMDRIAGALAKAEVFAAIGTSGLVYPAAGFVADAKRHGAIAVEVNNAQTDVSGRFDHHFVGSATEQVQRFVEWYLE